jgi:uncharacterized protein YnzC (UPF0291/DUF896 family)
MLTADKIKRINELAKKAKNEGLNEQEKEEQSLLRREYIDSVRNSLKANLDTITIVKVDEDGNELERTPLKNKGKHVH